jgi:hypothetical protein
MGAGRAATKVQMFAMRMCRDGTIDMANSGMVLGVVMSVIVIMITCVLVSMAMHGAIGMRMHMPALVLVTMDGAINVRFAGAATASCTHVRILQIRQS